MAFNFDINEYISTMWQCGYNRVDLHCKGGMTKASKGNMHIIVYKHEIGSITRYVDSRIICFRCDRKSEIAQLNINHEKQGGLNL